MGRGSAGVVGAAPSGAADAAKRRAGACGDGLRAAGCCDPSRRDAAVAAFFVFAIYLFGYFCWFASVMHFYVSEYHMVWELIPKATREQFRTVVAGSCIAAFTALPLTPLVAAEEGALPIFPRGDGAPLLLPRRAHRRAKGALCALHVVGAVVFMGGLSGFLHDDEQGGTWAPWAPSSTASHAAVLGTTTRQLLMPLFSSACLVYLCVMQIAERTVPTLPATLTLSLMTFWLYLSGFFIDFANKGGGTGHGSAGAVAAGSFFAAFTPPATTCFSAVGHALPLTQQLSTERRGDLVLLLTALHGVGFFIFFCGACAWLNYQFDLLASEYSPSVRPSFIKSEHLSEITLFIFVPMFFSGYFLSRSFRLGSALRGGYESVEGGAAVSDAISDRHL